MNYFYSLQNWSTLYHSLESILGTYDVATVRLYQSSANIIYKSIKLYFFFQVLEGFASYERSLLNLDNCYFITVELHAFQSRRTFFVTFLKHANYNAFTVARASNATIFLCVNEKRTGDID